MTFQQAKAKGLKIKKGAKSTQLVRLVKIEKSVPKKQENEDEVEEEVMAPGKNGFWVMKRFNVFNGNQIDGLEPLPVTEKNEVASIAAVDAIAERMKATGLKTIHGGNIAAYGEKLDVVFMPDRSSFQNSEDYYATLLHELAHATGAEKRLKRFLANARFGSSQYAREELVAEISAAMMCAELGMAISPTHIENHASYVASWLKCLKADKNAIFVAASAAEHVCQYLREQAPTEMPEVDSVEVAESLAA
jgi:antirestriction protein ArdC